jgi:hypothetical protein
MPTLTIHRSTEIVATPRVQQVSGIFDLPPAQASERSWTVSLPLEAHPWSIGLVTGPSGCGKSTLARELWPAAASLSFDWPGDRAVVDAFPARMPIKEITGLLSAVGFSSPPAWLRPFSALSNGEQFRCTLARTLAECPELAVVDEFTSVVDRTVARVGSCAVAKAVRRRGGQFVAVTCHDDLIDWLDPDWIYLPAEDAFHWRRERQPRPPIRLEIRRVGRDAWRTFHHHHYLSSDLNRSAKCFAGFVDGRPAVFTAVISFPHPTVPSWREHRTVCLPDFQGVGIGNAFAEFVASLFAATGKRYISTTSHPAMIHHRARSPLWNMHRRPGMVRESGASAVMRVNTPNANLQQTVHTSRGRITAGFTYTGPANREAAQVLGVV